MNRIETRPEKKRKVPFKKATIKKAERRTDMRRFVADFYSRYGEMMTRLSHE